MLHFVDSAVLDEWHRLALPCSMVMNLEIVQLTMSAIECV